MLKASALVILIEIAKLLAMEVIPLAMYWGTWYTVGFEIFLLGIREFENIQVI